MHPVHLLFKILPDSFAVMIVTFCLCFVPKWEATW